MKVIIVGGGQTGSYIGKRLLEANYEIIIMENREKVLESLYREFDAKYVYAGSGTEPSNLEQVGIDTADVVVGATGSDEVNLVVSTLSKFEYGVRRVIGRVNNPRNSWLFEKRMGVDVALNQAEFLSKIVIDEIDLKHFEVLLKVNRGKNSIVQIPVVGGSSSIGKTIDMLNIPQHSVFVAVIRNDEMEAVHGKTVVFEGDVFFVFASPLEQQIVVDLLN